MTLLHIKVPTSSLHKILGRVTFAFIIVFYICRHLDVLWLVYVQRHQNITLIKDYKHPPCYGKGIGKGILIMFSTMLLDLLDMTMS